MDRSTFEAKQILGIPAIYRLCSENFEPYLFFIFVVEKTSKIIDFHFSRIITGILFSFFGSVPLLYSTVSFLDFM